MSDNEKRAHDIAVSAMPILYDQNVRADETLPSSMEKFNPYNTYITCYNEVLEQLNEDYAIGR